MSIEDADVIDFVAHDPNGEVVLVMVEGREWDGSDERLFELQERINSYASFATERLSEHYPELAGKPVRLALRCAFPPDPRTADVIKMIRGKLEEEGLMFSVELIGRDPSG